MQGENIETSWTACLHLTFPRQQNKDLSFALFPWARSSFRFQLGKIQQENILFFNPFMPEIVADPHEGFILGLENLPSDIQKRSQPMCIDFHSPAFLLPQNASPLQSPVIAKEYHSGDQCGGQ